MPKKLKYQIMFNKWIKFRRKVSFESDAAAKVREVKWNLNFNSE